MKWLIVCVFALFFATANSLDSIVVYSVPDSAMIDTNEIRLLLKQTEQKLDSLIIQLENEELQRD